MAELTDENYAAATERGNWLFVEEPHALSARYDRTTQRMVVELTNGSTFAFPPRAVRGLERATPAQLDSVELSGGGYGLHWEALDADYTVSGLLAGRFGKTGSNPPPAQSAAA